MGLYQAADFFVLRAPLLPVAAYYELGAGRAHALDDDERVQRALTVASERFFEALRSTPAQDVARAKVDAVLLRYLIRMSTRPTPFGLFAGTGLGCWGDRTDLELSSERRPQRTRPDMAWLMQVVQAAESNLAIRRRLRVVANRTALIRAGRVFLTERVSHGESAGPAGVSIRATRVVRRVLEVARDPIPYDALVSLLLHETPGATEGRIDAMLSELWEQTILLTDLRPPLTVDSPARYVVDRLASIPSADGTRAALQAVVDAAADWDSSPTTSSVPRFRAIAQAAAELASVDRLPFQVDSAVELTGRTISRLVSEEAARAAELLLTLSPLPRGPAHLVTYRRQFEQRYGAHREVPLLEVLDPNFGLGPPPYGEAAAEGGGPPVTAHRRTQRLLELAATALGERRRSITLDESALRDLQTWEPSVASAPRSLDLNVFVAAASREAVDAGDFRLVVGPNVGSMAAGRGLGRFADMTPEAHAALRGVAAAEEALEPDKLWAELSYQPRSARLGNVSTRPNLRRHEIAVGVSPGEEARPIPVDELVVGIRNGRFHVRWPAAGQEVVVTAGHMLTYLRAPAVCRFLSEVGRDRICHLAGFQWGAAAGLPFLPRVEVGRIVLSLAQWRLRAASLTDDALSDPDAFSCALDRWRDRWAAPQHLYLNAGDNRLLLDLADPEHAAELRRALTKQGPNRAAILTEVLPGLDEAWVEDAGHQRFMTELVVPLVRTSDGPRDAPAAHPRGAGTWPPATVHPPGSEWLYVKLYVGRDLEDDVLAGPLRSFAERAYASGLVEQWFFIRYNDPRRHLRLRFRGQPTLLLTELLPLVCAWTDELMQDGTLTRFAFDTYEPETQRFGGDRGSEAAEQLFSADSRVVVRLLDLLRAGTLPLDRLPVAALTVDALLEGLRMDAGRRAQWCSRHVTNRQESGQDYREWKGVLRRAVTNDAQLRAEPDVLALDEILVELRDAGATYRRTVAELAATGELTCALDDMVSSIVHLHLNRLVGTDSSVERRALGLLARVLEGLERSGSPAP